MSDQLSFGDFAGPTQIADPPRKESAEKSRELSSKSSKPSPLLNPKVSASLDFEDSQAFETKEAGPISTPQEPHIYSISELNKAIRQTIEGGFPLVWLKGEISNFKPHTSGHFYFSLKDSKSQMNAVMFRGFNTQLKFKPEDGMEVVVRGRVTVYEPRGQYQIFCEVMEPVGLGALQAAFEQLKNKLKAEGLFDRAKKRSLPPLPKRIAIVTSPTGAAIQDMLNVLGRRFKALEIVVVPTAVQGVQAPQEIVKAIQLANEVGGFDVMIVGRGGGSIEDLWAFNDERVARAISASKIPTVSAVGHEVDFTIADFVADLRAPTPSAAAELVVQNSMELSERLIASRNQLNLLSKRHFELKTRALENFEHRLIDPKKQLADFSQRCDELEERLGMSALQFLRSRRQSVLLLKEKMGSPERHLSKAQKRESLASSQLVSLVKMHLQKRSAQSQKWVSVLESLSPLKVVSRGYTIATTGGSIVTSAESLRVGDHLSLRFASGSADVEVKKIEITSSLESKGSHHGL